MATPTVDDICNELCTVEYDFIPPCDFVPTEDMVCDGGADIIKCLSTKWFCDGADAIPTDTDMGSVPYSSASSCAIPGLPTMKSLMAQLGALGNAIADMFDYFCSNLACLVGASVTTENPVIKLVGLDADGCLTGLPFPLGECDITVRSGSFGFTRARADMPGSTTETIGQITIPAFDCPMFIYIGYTGMADILGNDGMPFHVNQQIAVGSPAGLLAQADNYHSYSDYDGVNGWHSEAPCFTRVAVGAGTPTDLFFLLANDLNPFWGPTVFNLTSFAQGWWFAVPQ